MLRNFFFGISLLRPGYVGHHTYTIVNIIPKLPNYEMKAMNSTTCLH